MKKNVTSQNLSYDKVKGLKGGRDGRGLMRGVERERERERTRTQITGRPGEGRIMGADGESKITV